ncbi:MAG: methylenetetrahydrofolate reductase C-terminal domain-containing protein [Dehalococcoidia bacterium]|nr:methylenetetrahydrofolate reductase C-terminal domain-containing protein [Dehalococcoidia bacterium]
MKTITAQKPLAEVMGYIERWQSVYIIGCGTCATMCRTGGKAEVMAMKAEIETSGKKVTGWMVVPTACDELVADAMREESEDIAAADCILVMSCSFGVQTISLHQTKPIYPALDTLFLGIEDRPGHFVEVCAQCGKCVLGRTAAICPLVRCAKSLFNGPCGGSSGGKCEISENVPCAWQMIYDRLAEMGLLDELDEIEPVKDWDVSSSGGPRAADVDAECGVVPRAEKAEVQTT